MSLKVLAVNWERHRRMQGLCASLGVPLQEMEHGGGRIGRYLNLARRTLALIRERRPRVLIVQNPSIALAFFALLMRWFYRFRLVVDAHNEAVQPFIHTSWPIPALARLLMRRADLTIVTNGKLAGVVTAAGGRPFVLPDCLPAVPLEVNTPPVAGDPMDVMVISTFAPDEPLAEIAAAAERLGDGFRFHVTGNDRKLDPEIRARLPGNVRLTGFLPEHDYWILMRDSHLVLDLTLMPDCLVCGAYEALAALRPMILSDSDATRELFGSVAVLSGASADEIAGSLQRARDSFAELTAAMPRGRDRFEADWRERAADLTQWLRNS